MTKFQSTQKIGEIAAEFPKATEVFEKNKIDFCCGGDRILLDVIKESNLNEPQIISEINELYEKFKDTKGKDWREAPFDELIDHIINTHHAYLWRELPETGNLVTTILRVHGENHPELMDIYKDYNALRTELEIHLTKEEITQYPAIRKYLETDSKEDLKIAVNIIDELEEEHTEAGNLLKELRRLTNNYTLPADACTTYDKTYKKLEEMESDIFQHIHLENNILFPRLRELL